MYIDLKNRDFFKPLNTDSYIRRTIISFFFIKLADKSQEIQVKGANKIIIKS
jgi:hypothetical protein